MCARFLGLALSRVHTFEACKACKACKASLDIPAKILQTNADLFSSPLTEIFNNLVVDCAFPDDLKLADISSLYKKDDNMRNQNYRPISLLPAVSKVFERIMYNQLFDYIGTFSLHFWVAFEKDITRSTFC